MSPPGPQRLQVTLKEAPGSVSWARPPISWALTGNQSLNLAGNMKCGAGSINERLRACGSPDAWPDGTYTPLPQTELNHSLPLLRSPGAAMFTVYQLYWSIWIEYEWIEWYLQEKKLVIRFGHDYAKKSHTSPVNSVFHLFISINIIGLS